MCPLRVKGGVHRWTMKHREGWPASASCLGSNRRLQSPVAAAGSVSTRSQAQCKVPTKLGRLQIRLWISTVFSQTDWMEFERWEIRALPRTGQEQTAWFPSQKSPALIKGSVFAPRMGKANTQEYLSAMTEVRVSLQTKLCVTMCDNPVFPLNSCKLV